MNSLNVKNLSISVNQNTLFQNLSFSLKNGEIIGICEPTGSGKSTLLNYIAQILDEQRFEVEGKIERNFSNISYVFQDLLLLPGYSVIKNVMIPVKKLFSQEKCEEKARKILNLVKLDNKIDEKVRNLSGGEKQRVAIARAIIYPGELLILDEPFHSQDEEKKDVLIELIKNVVKQENRMCIIVSHNLNDLEKIGARMIKFK